MGPIAQALASQIANLGIVSLIPAPYFCKAYEIFSMVILLHLLILDSLLSVTSESMCTEYWLTAYSKLAQR